MRIAFDLDGTLYDTLPHTLEVENINLAEKGYPAITEDTSRSLLQSHDWKQYYRDMGVREEDIQPLLDLFYKRWIEREPPQLIHGALEVITLAENKFGEDNVFLLSNEVRSLIDKRLIRDGLDRYLSRIVSSLEGKTSLLLDLSQREDSKLIYVGDLVSDGEACLQARAQGANNLSFLALTHAYGMNHPEDLRRFALEHADFATEIKNFKELTDYLHSL
ncbi:MAG: HAD hydrolase-like protein [Candidatus Woesearchaeota archaeon]|jgi:phosphoglycolate phosphatase-like HAD superfamily hydrolase